MSADKYRSIFLRQMATIVYLYYHTEYFHKDKNVLSFMGNWMHTRLKWLKTNGTC